MKYISILGAGESGIGAALLAKDKGYDVFISENGKLNESKKSILNLHNIKFEESGHSLEKLQKSDFIVKSPGIPNNSPIINLLKDKTIISEIDFGYRYIKDKKIIAVTGTNGKSTTCALIYHILKNANKKVCLVGNIGNSLSKEILKKSQYDYYVVELSSFQIEDIKEFKADIGILLNINPDHLDRYSKFQDYIDVKLQLSNLITPGGCFIYFKNNKYVNHKITQNLKVYIIDPINDYDDKFTLLDNENYLFYKNDTSLLGMHNLYNIKFASTVAHLCNIEKEEIMSSVKSFGTLPHRLEFVREIDGIKFYNDSKATNLDSVIKSLNSFPNSIIWIAGGIDKGNDYELLGKKLVKKIKYLICLGKDNNKLKKSFPKKFIHETTHMREAIYTAYNHACNGDIILLSPACSSLDLYIDYVERGNIFRSTVELL